MNSKEIRGMVILAKGDLPIVIDEGHFVVPSQSGAASILPLVLRAGSVVALTL